MARELWMTELPDWQNRQAQGQCTSPASRACRARGSDAATLHCMNWACVRWPLLNDVIWADLE